MRKRPTTRRNFLAGAAALAATSGGPLARLALTARFALPSSSDDLERRLASDPLRPQYHLLPASGWMNDPNGPIYWRGRYHMFFQYNPNAAVWGDMHWAHAVSDDMIHWRHLPIALAPTPGWDDAGGCFSGSAVNENGVATVIYTGVRAVPAAEATLRDGVHDFREVQCLATATDRELLEWKKWPHPVLEPPSRSKAGGPITGFRDPFMWREGAVWYLGVGSGLHRVGGRVFLYRSHNLRQWEYLHPLAEGKWTSGERVNPLDSGEMWECPDFFPLGKKHVLLYSTANRVIWETGELDHREMRFHREKTGILDHGAYYAQKTQLDAGGRRILWGWIPETRPEADYSAAGWAGCMALPRELAVAPDGTLGMRFADATRSLRGKRLGDPLNSAAAPDRNAVSPAPHNAPVELPAVPEPCWELLFHSRSRSVALQVVDNAGPWLSLWFKADVSAARLSLNDKTIEFPQPAGASQPKGSENPEHRFHLFVDGSVVELLCDARHAITTRIYRRNEGPLRLQFHEAGSAGRPELEFYALRPISRDRLTT